MSADDCAEFLADPILSTRDKGGLVLVGPKGAGAAVHSKHEAARATIWKKTAEVLQQVDKRNAAAAAAAASSVGPAA